MAEKKKIPAIVAPADSDKKNEILGKLFDNSAYVYYENLLDGARAALEKRRAGGI